ncbi:class B sortase [Xylanivirga thermophila]|uniref:class B sortase n=1 Tax=Xylanivirga thermophila TaxID=2496273 RepID=UPI00101DBCD0|nr:class B sortase [Xylanivirga thermophila]
MRRVIIFICIIVFALSIFQISRYIVDSKKTNDLYGKTAKIYDEGKRDIKKLEKINDNIICWINIPGTKINYPVVKGEDNSYYLNHDIDGNENRHGAIFMDYKNNPKDDKNIIIYGHHMKDGTMFKDLVKFKDKTFFDKNRFIYVDMYDKKIPYEIFSVYITDAYDPYTQISFKDGNDYSNFFNRIKEKSLFPSDVEFSEKETILTLSTCTYEYNDARLVIHARSTE